MYPWCRAGCGRGVAGGWWIGPTNHTTPSRLCPGQFYGKGVLRVCVCVCVSVFPVCCVSWVVGQPSVYHTGPHPGARYRPLVGGAHVERIQSPCVGSMSMQRGEHRALGWPPPRHTVGRRPAREWWQVRETLTIPVCGLVSGVPLLNCGGNSGNHPAECGDCYRWGLVPAFMNQA